jgi:hypothetical protein
MQSASDYVFILRWEKAWAKAEKKPGKQQELLIQLKEQEEKIQGGKPSKLPPPSAAELASYGPIMTHMIKSHQLKTQVFSHTNMGTMAIPTYIRHLRHLHEANFAYNELLVIPQELTSLPFLRKLILAGNKLRFIPPLSGCPLLEVLDCHSNEITDFPADIGHLQFLQTIDMERNKIVVIPDEISSLQKLQFLNLTRNNVKLVPPQIGTITAMCYLKLAHNPIVNLPAHIYIKGTQASMAYLREYIPEAAHITESSMVSDLAKFMNKELFSDVIFRTTKTGTQFFAHRIMIDARCAALYKLIINTENDVRDMRQLNSALKESVATASDAIASISAATAQVDLSTQKYFDQQKRLIVDVDVTEEELEYLLTYIYGDVFNPPRPELFNPTPNMKSEEVMAVEQANKKAINVFNDFCTTMSEFALKFGLERLSKLAIAIVKPTEKILPTSYFTDFERFCLKPKHSDVSFMVEGRTIMTHKLLICARSQYFNNMLTGGLIESTLDVIPFIDVSYHVLRSIFEFCYTDDLNCTAETVMDLLMSSRVYGIERLKGMVETIVGYSLDVDNAPGIFSIAELYSFKRLSKACKYFIMSNWRNVTTGADWDQLEPRLIEQLTLKARNWKII